MRYCEGVLAAICALAATGCEDKVPVANIPTGVSSSVPAPAASCSSVLLEAAPGEWVSLFDGKTLNGWRVLTEKAFAGHKGVRVDNGTIVMERGQLQTGIGWEGAFPSEDYEVSLEAMRTDGHDFFCGMTFPVGQEPCTLIIGGWGGSVVGLSNVDQMPAAENMTTNSISFESNRWYVIRLRVTGRKIDVWIDDQHMISLEREGRSFSVWWEQEAARPFGIANWDTESALRNIRFRRLVD